VVDQFREAIQSVVSCHQPKLLVINLGGVPFIDSSGLGLLVAARANLERNEGRLHICGLTPTVRKTFDQTNLGNYFAIFSIEEDALLGA
jgi:anti-anti-sigma factor